LFVLENYPGTILVDTAPRSEAWSPTQQHAQIEAAITMGALSHAPDGDVKSRPSATAIKILQQIDRRPLVPRRRSGRP
jgi:hypothetical protein